MALEEAPSGPLSRPFRLGSRRLKRFNLLKSRGRVPGRPTGDSGASERLEGSDAPPPPPIPLIWGAPPPRFVISSQNASAEGALLRKCLLENPRVGRFGGGFMPPLLGGPLRLLLPFRACGERTYQPQSPGRAAASLGAPGGACASLVIQGLLRLTN